MPHRAILDVLVLDGDRAAVGGLEVVDDLAQRRALRHAIDAVTGELAIKVRLRDAEGLGLEVDVLELVIEAERVEVAGQVADVAKGIDQAVGALLVATPRDLGAAHHGHGARFGG